MVGRDQNTTVTITVAARRVGLSPWTVRRYVRRGLLAEALTEDELAELRRIRRLTELGINLAGVEVILSMRRQIEQLQAEVARLEALLR
jgi:MerR family transcriptional regulator/heat shock protein HspR